MEILIAIAVFAFVVMGMWVINMVMNRSQAKRPSSVGSASGDYGGTTGYGGGGDHSSSGDGGGGGGDGGGGC